MPSNQRDYLDQAAEHWERGRPLEAGRLIFEHLAAEIRPIWASNILRLVVDRRVVEVSPVARLLRTSPILRVLRIAEAPSKWRRARGAFYSARKMTLRLEALHARSKEQERTLCTLYLAENVAKVIYNATQPTDEFDEDAGWWIASCLRSIVDCLNDDGFSNDAWSTLRGCYVN